jgi:dihydropteroate synthase
MQNVEAAGLDIGDDHPPRIMGVLNVSEESPYDPSVFSDSGKAAEYVERELIDEGADIVDIGLESANKRLDVLSPEEELARFNTAIETIESVSGEAVFSIETRYAKVADEALSRGFDMVNDICGFADPAMPEVCEAHAAAVVKMASPPDLNRPGAVESVEEIYEALGMNGLTEKTILDPAFGGWSAEKTLEDDRETFHRLREFRAYGHPILVSINRKNFLRDIAGRTTEESLSVSLAATAMAVERGAHVLRTHDVKETRDAACIGKAFSGNRLRDPAVEELDVRTRKEAKRHLATVDGNPKLADEITRWFRLSGVSEEYELLAAAVADTEGVSLAGDDSLLLVGTARGFESLERTIPVDSSCLSTLFSKILHEFS